LPLLTTKEKRTIKTVANMKVNFSLDYLSTLAIVELKK